MERLEWLKSLRVGDKVLRRNAVSQVIKTIVGETDTCWRVGTGEELYYKETGVKRGTSNDVFGRVCLGQVTEKDIEKEKRDQLIEEFRRLTESTIHLSNDKLSEIIQIIKNGKG